MAGANSKAIDGFSEEVGVKSLSKRYQGLVTVRTRAITGKGAWYWAHLEPVLINNAENNLPKAVKLKCNLCDAVFSASNPSRTATEHLKRGSCPNFSSVPISQLPPLASPSSNHHQRKRSSQETGTSSSLYPVDLPSFSNERSYSPTPISQVPALPLTLSGGKEDLGALALLENSVKKLKSPKASHGPALSNDQVCSAFDLLADWFFESCGPVSFSSLEHPKFKAFLNHVGLPVVSSREFSGARLDTKFGEARAETEARIREAAFFQVASEGWKSRSCGSDAQGVLIKFMVNLPNGTRVFQKTVYISSGGGSVPSEHAEEVMWETIRGICGGNAVMQRCIGVVADKYNTKALRNLEIQHHWMVNLSCQLKGFFSLIKDFCRELQLFRAVTSNCLKIAHLFNSSSQIRHNFRKFKLQGVGFIRVPPPNCDISENISSFVALLEDMLSYSRILHLIVLDDSYEVVCLEDPAAREVADMVQDVGFWNDVEATHSLVKLVTGMAKAVAAERPLVSQCIPLWEELRGMVKDWCSKYRFDYGPVEEIVQRRFKKNYHPAWSAAFVLDPQYLVKDDSGKYLPRFKCLTQEQENDVDTLLKRLVTTEEAQMVMVELMRWRSEGLDPLYAQAVQVKQRDPISGKMKIANPQSSRLVWETCLKDLKCLSKVAMRLLFLHATSCGINSNESSMRLFHAQGHSKLVVERNQKLIFLASHAKLKRQDFSSEEEKDAELFSSMNGEDDMLNKVLAGSSSM